MRIEWYRNIRRRHDEIEEMASRPFASIQLDLTGDQKNSVFLLYVEMVNFFEQLF